MRPFPKTSEEHARLARLEGNWVGEEILYPSPWDQGGKADGRWRMRMGLGGFYLIADYVQSRDGDETHFQGHGLYGWDVRGRCYTLHWFDSSGVEHHAPMIGAWEGDALTLQHELSEYGASRQVYEFQDDGFAFRIEISPDGRAWSPFLEGRYRRA